MTVSVQALGADGQSYADFALDVHNAYSSGNVAAATATATIPANTTKKSYISGFMVTGGGATGASVINGTITGLQGGTMTFAIAVPAGATLGIYPLIVEFPKPIPSSAINTAIVVSVPTFGAGNTNACVTAFGFSQ